MVPRAACQKAGTDKVCQDSDGHSYIVLGRTLKWDWNNQSRLRYRSAIYSYISSADRECSCLNNQKAQANIENILVPTEPNSKVFHEHIPTAASIQEVIDAAMWY